MANIKTTNVPIKQRDQQERERERPTHSMLPPTLPLGNVKHPEARKIDRHYLKVRKVVELAFKLSYA